MIGRTPEEADQATRNRQASVTVKLPTGTEVVFDLDPLSFEIDAGASSHRVLAPKIELNLVKKLVGAKWAKLERDPQDTAPVAGQTISKHPPPLPYRDPPPHRPPSQTQPSAGPS